MNEIGIVERIRQMSRARLPSKRGGILIGIGDDCAIFRPKPGEDLLFTTDQMIEDVHFRATHKPAAVGERALARSLSDIAAMGGEPRFCLVALATPAKHGDVEQRNVAHEKWIEAFYRGLLRLANRTGTVLAGGDLSHSGTNKTHCDVMVCGAVKRGRALRRDGARPGDAIYVSGRLGKSWERRIEPRLALGQALVGRATSCIDLSDGLSLDLYRLCMASRVAAEIDRIPLVRATRGIIGRANHAASMERALHGGEDYELLFTLRPKAAAPAGSTRGATRIGTIVRGKPGEMMFQGRPLEPRGYDHFK
jgi:thiamine-monophosphate kinase